MNQGVGVVNDFIRVFFVKDRLIADGIIGRIMSKLVTDLA